MRSACQYNPTFSEDLLLRGDGLIATMHQAGSRHCHMMQNVLVNDMYTDSCSWKCLWSRVNETLCITSECFVWPG